MVRESSPASAVRESSPVVVRESSLAVRDAPAVRESSPAPAVRESSPVVVRESSPAVRSIARTNLPTNIDSELAAPAKSSVDDDVGVDDDVNV